MRLPAAVAAACLLALAAAGTASAGGASEFTGHHRQAYRIVIVPWLTTANLPALADRGAVGLLVPNAGPWTSGSDALAGLVRGTLYNARLPRPTDTVLVHVEKSLAIPDHGSAIVLGMPPQSEVPNTERYPIAVLGPGYHGLLVSSLTRVPGLVSMADVARTALRTSHRLQAQDAAHPAAALTRLEARIESSRRSTMAGSVLVLALLIAFALIFPRGAPAALGSALAANLVLGWAGGGPVANLAVLGICTVAGGVLGARFLGSRTALGAALVAVLATYAAAMVVHPPALSLAPMGPELTSRFFGISNLIETLLLGPALLGARLLADRFGWPAVAAVGALALATVAENRLGADGGGALVVGVAFAFLATLLLARSRRAIVPSLAAAALAAYGLLAADAASSGPDHLRGALHGGLRGLGHVAANRVPLAYERMLEQWYLVFPALAALAVGALAVRRARSRGDAAVVVALLAALGASLLVNDSPGPVTLAGLATLLAVEGGVLRSEVAVPLARRAVQAVEAATGRTAPQE
jgi:hypothetical protein